MAKCGLCEKEVRAADLAELRAVYMTKQVKDVCSACQRQLNNLVRDAHGCMARMIRLRIVRMKNRNAVTASRRREINFKARIALMLFDLLVLAVCLVLIAVINQVV